MSKGQNFSTLEENDSWLVSGVAENKGVDTWELQSSHPSKFVQSGHSYSEEKANDPDSAEVSRGGMPRGQRGGLVAILLPAGFPVTGSRFL